MEILGIIVFFVVIAVIRGALENASHQRTIDRLADEVGKGLTIRCRPDTWQPEDSDERWSVIHVILSGTVVCPRPNYPACFRVRVLDVTDSNDDPMPVFCGVSELSDDDGVYAFDQECELPYEVSSIDKMDLASIPSFALVGPREGRRQLRVFVMITGAHNIENVLAAGEVTHQYTQEMVGYATRRENTEKFERQIAMLALTVSASDGHIDKRESKVIRRFFAEAYESRDDGEERKRDVTKVLQSTLKKLKSGDETPDEIIDRVCGDLHAADDGSASQAAYELCVDVVAADDSVEPVERETLNRIGSRLGLSREFVTEVEERAFRLSMFDEIEEEDALGIPRGLSPEDKIKHLDQEYRKWRRRVTHSDPSVASDASMRMERIAKLRSQLSRA